MVRPVFSEKMIYCKFTLFSDGTLLYERVPNKPEAEKAALNNISPSLLKRRAYEEVNGMDGKDLMQKIFNLISYTILYSAYHNEYRGFKAL